MPCRNRRRGPDKRLAWALIVYLLACLREHRKQFERFPNEAGQAAAFRRVIAFKTIVQALRAYSGVARA